MGERKVKPKQKKNVIKQLYGIWEAKLLNLKTDKQCQGQCKG